MANGTETYFIEIGNTDNKLTQQTWSTFVYNIDQMLKEPGTEVIILGRFFSEPSEPYQNACWHFNCYSNLIVENMYLQLQRLCKSYDQDGIAWSNAVTELLGPTDE